MMGYSVYEFSIIYHLFPAYFHKRVKRDKCKKSGSPKHSHRKIITMKRKRARTLWWDRWWMYLKSKLSLEIPGSQGRKGNKMSSIDAVFLQNEASDLFRRHAFFFFFFFFSHKIQEYFSEASHWRHVNIMSSVTGFSDFSCGSLSWSWTSIIGCLRS